MSYSYSYKKSSSSGGPGGSSYSIQSSGPSGSSNYSYQTSSYSNSSPLPNMANDSEFQNAKMQAMMGSPGSYRINSSSSSSSSTPTVKVAGTTNMAEMEEEMARMQREMESSMRPGITNSGNSTYSHSTVSSSNSTTPKLIYPESSSGGTTVKKVVTTTTTKTNPQAMRELESIERDFSRLGRTPENYHDDFDKIKKEVLTGEAYDDPSLSSDRPVHRQLREEITRTTRKEDNSNGATAIPVSVHQRANNDGIHEVTTTTTTKTFGSGAPDVSEQKVVTTSGSSNALHMRPDIRSETFIPIKTYDSSFDDFHMNRWMDHRDHWDSYGAGDLDLHRLDWQNRLGGIKRDFYSFGPHSGLPSAHIDSSQTVSKRRPLRRSQSCRTTRTYYSQSVVPPTNPLGKPEFSVQFDMKDYKPEDITLTTKHGKLTISAAREEKIGNSTSRREFSRTVDLPTDVQVNMMKSVYSRDGILSITAPIKAPNYNSSLFGYSPYPHTNGFNLDNSYSSQTQLNHPTTNGHLHLNRNARNMEDSRLNKAGSVSQLAESTETKHGFSFIVPVSGFKASDITVSLDGRKLRVDGKHTTSSTSGRKIHNEFIKVFELPEEVIATDIQAYLRDGHTLHISVKSETNCEQTAALLTSAHES